jgi:Spy/CpxP family protein refolding chaperone
VRRTTAVAAIAALFLLGIAVGVLGTHAFYFHELHKPGGLAGFGTRLFAAQLERRLDLTPEQRRQVDGILAEARAEVAALRRQTHPRILAVMERCHHRIVQVLDPKQRAALERHSRRHRHRMHELLEP